MRVKTSLGAARHDSTGHQKVSTLSWAVTDLAVIVVAERIVVLITGFPAGAFGTNCFVLADSAGSECLVIDPGMEATQRLASVVEQHNLRPVAVLLTHGHLDHTWSVVPVCDGYGIAAYIHHADEHMLADPMSGISRDMQMMLQQFTGAEQVSFEPDEVRDLTDRAVLDIAGVQLEVRHGPGHTPGSVSFHLDSGRAPVMLSGDLLFAGSIGRTDLPGGDHQQMLQSLRDVVLPLEDQTVVLPGHGPQTTIGDERTRNPYLLDLLATGR